jgi:hypothetical protein
MTNVTEVSRLEFAVMKLLFDRTEAAGMACEGIRAEGETTMTTDRATLIQLALASGSCRLLFPKGADGKRNWVDLIFNNGAGWDVISDAGNDEGPFDILTSQVCRDADPDMALVPVCNNDTPAYIQNLNIHYYRGACVNCGSYHGHPGFVDKSKRAP